jgi:hypothetical protein
MHKSERASEQKKNPFSFFFFFLCVYSVEDFCGESMVALDPVDLRTKVKNKRRDLKEFYQKCYKCIW